MISVSGEERMVLHAKYPAKSAEKKTKMNLRGHIPGKRGRNSKSMILFIGYRFLFVFLRMVVEEFRQKTSRLYGEASAFFIKGFW